MEEAESEQDTSGLSAPESPPLERVRHQHFPYAPLQSNPHAMPASLQPARNPYAPPGPYMQPARGPYAPPAPRIEPAMIVNLDDQFPIGPETASNPYTSVGVLAPCITIERHGQQLHIAARFNIETTIQNYSSANRYSSQAAEKIPALIPLVVIVTNYFSTTYVSSISTIRLRRSWLCGLNRIRLDHLQ